MNIKTLLYFFALIFLFPLVLKAQDNLFSGIEIGSKGIKVSIIEIMNIEKGEYKIVKFWTDNVGVAKGISKNGNITKEDIDQAGIVVSQDLNRLKTEFKIKDQNIFIVASSGVAVAKNKKDLKDRIMSSTQKKMDFIDAADEAELLIKGCIPFTMYDKSFLLDIGGGNTKGGYMDVNKDDRSDYKFVPFPLALDYGVISLTEAVYKKLGKKPEEVSIKEFTDKVNEFVAVLKDKTVNMLNSKPSSLSRKNLFFSGGAVWAFKTLFDENEGSLRFVQLRLSDIERYNTIIVNDFENYKKQAVNNQNIAKVLSTYDQKQLIVANTIFLACLKSIPDIENKRIYFPKDGHIAWLVSYVVDHSKKVKK